MDVIKVNEMAMDLRNQINVMSKQIDMLSDYIISSIEAEPKTEPVQELLTYGYQVTFSGITPKNKIGAIKAIRQVLGLNLKAAKQLAESGENYAYGIAYFNSAREARTLIQLFRPLQIMTTDPIVTCW